jgi:hypothetical protein
LRAAWAAAAAATGSGNAPVQQRDHGRDQAAGFPSHGAALSDTLPLPTILPQIGSLTLAHQEDGMQMQGAALLALIAAENVAIVQETRPSTQVD